MGGLLVQFLGLFALLGLVGWGYRRWISPRRVGIQGRGMPSAEDLKTALGMVQESFALAAVGIASYDPDFDPDRRVFAVSLA